MKIAFLLDNAYGIGGTIRSTVNLSRALVERHTVEVVSLRRTRREPALPFDRRVAMTHLVDLRGDSRTYDGDQPLFHQPSARFSEGPDHLERGIATRLGDLRMEEYLKNTDADVVIATRPKLNDYLAGYGDGRYLRIGQEHLTHAMHNTHVRTHQDAAVQQLDAFVTVSYADAAAYRAAVSDGGDGDRVPETGPLITCIPNAVPAADVEPSDGETKLIVAAGRLIKVKRYDRLISAFALVCESHPDWRLRLYGRGRMHAPLRAHIESLGLYDRAFLMGAHSPIETEWAKGAVAAVSSNAESFGMTLVEAMHCGVPVVSTDCPYGPGEIITNGHDGLLSPLYDDEEVTVRAYADALLQLIENPDLRHRMRTAALRKAERYAPQRIAGEYEQLIEKLAQARPSGQRVRAATARPESGATPRPAAEPQRGPEPEPEVAPRAASEATPQPHPAPEAAAKPAAATPRASAPAAVPAPFRLVLRRHAVRLLRPVLGPVVRRVRARRPKPPAEDVKLRRPLCRVRVAADGGLLVRLQARRLPRGDASLLLRVRRQERATPFRVPLPPRSEAVDGWLEVRLDRYVHPLQEARWDAFVERSADGRRKRVRVALVETARLLSMPAPLDAEGALVPWVPYTTADGYLAVRTWRRRGHAEVTSIEMGRDACTVRARLYGTAARPDAVEGGAVLAVSRKESSQHGFEVPVRPSQEAGGPGAEGGGGSLAFDLPYELLGTLDPGGTNAVWDLWFRPGPQGSEPVRLSRLLGDLPDRKKTDQMPRVRLGESGTGVWPYFSLSNNLALMLQPLPHEEPVPAPAPAVAGARSASAGGTPAQGASSSSASANT